MNEQSQLKELRKSIINNTDPPPQPLKPESSHLSPSKPQNFNDQVITASALKKTSNRKNSSSSSSSMLNILDKANESGFEEDSEPDNDGQEETPMNLRQGYQNNLNPESTKAKQVGSGLQQEEENQNQLELSLEEGDKPAIQKPAPQISVPRPIPLITASYSLKPDMLFGWKPDISTIHGAPIPLYFDYEDMEVPINPQTDEEYPVTYFGPRFRDSLEMHKAFANKTEILSNGEELQTYRFKFPPNMNVIEACMPPKKKSEDRPFTGMNPLILTNPNNSINPEMFQQPSLIFDSMFESGNLDMVVQIREHEYDLYMRVDSNTRGHHQWFYFTVQNDLYKGKVKFNIVNFTKNASLYHQGMRISVHSKRDNEKKNAQQPLENEGWVKGCEHINYKMSKLSQPRLIPGFGYQFPQGKRYFQVSFEYEFRNIGDKVTFAYSVPYTFTKLQNYVRMIMKNHVENQPTSEGQYMKESTLCKSLSGLEVPVLTISSRVNSRTFEVIDESEFTSDSPPPLNKYKKYIIVCSRVHPGETNASFIMQGFLNFITSNEPYAVDLRKRIVFKVIPMTNPDGVIVGNYRTSMSGNDLNRQFHAPNTKLHPTVCAIKSMVSEIIRNAKEPEPLSSFIDIHGHSRKKSIFIYGPHFPLHNERYLKMRVLPKLLSERSDMFRFYSCKFRIQKSKLKAARVVLWREFSIMNCFTLEASFHGYINQDRQTVELTTQMFENMGQILGEGFWEYQGMIEEDERMKEQLRKQIKMKKKNKGNKMNKEGSGMATQNNDESMDQGTRNDQNNALQQDTKMQQQPLQNIPEMNNSSAEENSPSKKISTIEENQDFKPKQKKALQQAPLQQLSSAGAFRIKKQKSQQNPQKQIQPTKTPATANNNPSGVQAPQTTTPSTVKDKNHRRTLKEIYRLLKRDVRNSIGTTNEITNNTKTGFNKKNYTEGNDKQGFSSESEDSDESCCDGGGGGNDFLEEKGGDDLTPSELEDLQNDIIKALENFDQLYNKNKAPKSLDRTNAGKLIDQPLMIQAQKIVQIASGGGLDLSVKKIMQQNSNIIPEDIRHQVSTSQLYKRAMSLYENQNTTTDRNQKQRVGGQSILQAKRQSTSNHNSNNDTQSNLGQISNSQLQHARITSNGGNTNKNNQLIQAVFARQSQQNNQPQSFIQVIPQGGGAFPLLTTQTNSSLLISGIVYPNKQVPRKSGVAAVNGGGGMSNLQSIEQNNNVNSNTNVMNNIGEQQKHKLDRGLIMSQQQQQTFSAYEQKQSSFQNAATAKKPSQTTTAIQNKAVKIMSEQQQLFVQSVNSQQQIMQLRGGNNQTVNTQSAKKPQAVLSGSGHIMVQYKSQDRCSGQRPGTSNTTQQKPLQNPYTQLTALRHSKDYDHGTSFHYHPIQTLDQNQDDPGIYFPPMTQTTNSVTNHQSKTVFDQQYLMKHPQQVFSTPERQQPDMLLTNFTHQKPSHRGKMQVVESGSSGLFDEEESEYFGKLLKGTPPQKAQQKEQQHPLLSKVMVNSVQSATSITKQKEINQKHAVEYSKKSIGQQPPPHQSLINSYNFQNGTLFSRAAHQHNLQSHFSMPLSQQSELKINGQIPQHQQSVIIQNIIVNGHNNNLVFNNHSVSDQQQRVEFKNPPTQGGQQQQSQNFDRRTKSTNNRAGTSFKQAFANPYSESKNQQQNESLIFDNQLVTHNFVTPIKLKPEQITRRDSHTSNSLNQDNKRQVQKITQAVVKDSIQNFLQQQTEKKKAKQDSISSSQQNKLKK